MILAILGALSALFELSKVLVEKFVPTQVLKRNVKRPIEFAHGITNEQIRKIGIKKGLV